MHTATNKHACMYIILDRIITKYVTLGTLLLYLNNSYTKTNMTDATLV